MLSGSEGRDGLTSRGVCGVNSVLLNYQVAIIEYQLLFVFFFLKKKLYIFFLLIVPCSWIFLSLCIFTWESKWVSTPLENVIAARVASLVQIK